MMAKRIVLTLILAGMIVVPAAILRAQSSESTAEQQAAQTASQGGLLDLLDRLKEAQAQQLEGSWDITVTPVVPPGVPQPPSFIGHATISRGGAYFGSDRTRPFSKQHGTWTHLGGNEFAQTFKEDLFDGLGNFAGTLTVRTRVTVTGKDEYIGVANGEARDAAGNVIFNRCTTIRAARIKIEPLAPQCQSITPPR
jgi:hypothetical protein